MNPLPMILLAGLTSTLQVFSQVKNPALIKGARTYLPDPLVVPDFTPPIPVEPKHLPNIRIDSTNTFPTSTGKTLTLQRGEASTLPDLPLPPSPDPLQAPRELTEEQRARLIDRQRHTLNLGAMVYDHKVSQIHWVDQETGIFYQAICGFDIGLLAGIGTFVSNNEDYTIFLTHSDISSTSPRRSKIPLQVPKINPGEILITQGDPKNSAATAQLKLLRELIATEHTRLLSYQSARLRHQRSAAAWEKAHPPEPRDETIILRPHRGSRYLANPQPAKKEAAR